MRRIVAAGHELCNHMPHDRSYALLGEPAFAADLRAAEEALAAVPAATAAAVSKDVVPPADGRHVVRDGARAAAGRVLTPPRRRL